MSSYFLQVACSLTMVSFDMPFSICLLFCCLFDPANSIVADLHGDDRSKL